MEGVLVRSLKHAQGHTGILVTCEADVADLARLFGFLNRFDGAARGEDNVRIIEADDLMELQ
jgi:hypothetical protein